MNQRILLLLSLLFNFSSLISQPQPGDVFREYIWIPELVAEAGKFLRVGGRFDYKTYPDHLDPKHHEHGYIPLGKYVTLQQAIKAEVVLEKVASHEDTKGLRISMNGNTSIGVPHAAGIPDPESDYMHHTYPVTPIPLDHLEEGWGNRFRLDVDTAQRWQWPQNLIYGVILRVYYPSEIVKSKTEISSVVSGEVLSKKVDLTIRNPDQNIRQVDYIGWYDGLNYEGDGVYQQWHYHYLRGKIRHHIGSADEYPYNLSWNTSWIPDQTDEIKIAARIVDNSGLIYFTQAIGALTLKRDYSVELAKPYDQPKNWVTRQSDFLSKVELTENPKKVEAARLIWTSWSPCYANGVFVNGIRILEREGPCYDYMAHNIPINDLDILKKGVNIISTGKEPLHNGQMVHGMEVQWPGIMLLVKYRK